MKRTMLLALPLLALLTSCKTKTFYQVYEVKSNDVVEQENVLHFENEDCRVSYNLWANSGNLNFMLYNKTDRDLYLVMPRSFFIFNDVAHDYYSDTYSSVTSTDVSSASSSSRFSLGKLFKMNGALHSNNIESASNTSSTNSTTRSIQTHEAVLVCIPPKACKRITSFSISDYVFKDCNNYDANYPNTTSIPLEYNQDNTPIAFRNRIAYTFDAELKAEVKYIDNHFWVSSIQNYAEKSATKTVKQEICEYHDSVKTNVFTISSPTRFYNRYILDSKIPKPSKEQ